MPYFVLQQLDTKDNLSILFNEFMKELSSLDMISYPRSSMKQFQEDKILDVQFRFRTESLYGLTTLQNSLYSIHSKIIGALRMLKEYEEEYNFNWKHFASVERVRSIEEFGSDDDEDFNEDDSVKFKDDKKSLKHYTIKRRLTQFFSCNENDYSGEHIGSSRPCDFAYYIHIVMNSAQFSPFKMIEKAFGKEIPLYKSDELGEMIPMGLGDRIEAEINEEIKNTDVAHLFEMVLVHGMEAAKLFKSIKPFENEKEKYKQLQKALNDMLNLTYDLTD